MSSFEDVIKHSQITIIKESSEITMIKESSEITIIKESSEITIIKESSEITTIEESNESNNILTNPTHHTEDLLKLYDAKVNIRSSLGWLHLFRDRLKINKKRLELFNKTVFSKWIHIKSIEHDNHLLNHVLQHQRKVDFESKEFSMKFDIGDHSLELGRRELSLLTGFSVGIVNFPKLKAGDIPPLVRRLFPEKVPGKGKRPKGVSYNVKGDELLEFVTDDEKWMQISDRDAIRVCLLLMSEHVFMGRQQTHVMGKQIMMLAEDLRAWDNFPWGEYFWEGFYKRTVNLIHKNRYKYSQKLKIDPLSKAAYSINGFAWFLKVWILETFPNSHRWWFKDHNVFPRCLAWGDTNNRFEKIHYSELLGEGSNPKLILIATEDEIKQEWWNSNEHVHILDDTP